MSEVNNKKYGDYVFDAKQRWEQSEISLAKLVVEVLQIPKESLLKENFVDVDYYDRSIEIRVLNLAFVPNEIQLKTLWNNGFNSCIIHYVLISDPKKSHITHSRFSKKI